MGSPYDNIPPLMCPACVQPPVLNDGNFLNGSEFLSGEPTVATDIFDYYMSMNSAYYGPQQSYPLVYYTGGELPKAEIGPWGFLDNINPSIFPIEEYYEVSSPGSEDESNDSGSDNGIVRNTSIPPSPSPFPSPSPSPPSPQAPSIILISSRSPTPFTFTPPGSSPALSFSSLPSSPPSSPPTWRREISPLQPTSPPAIRRSTGTKSLSADQRLAVTDESILSGTSVTPTQKRKQDTIVIEDSDEEDSDDEYLYSPKKRKNTPKTKVQEVEKVDTLTKKTVEQERLDRTKKRMEEWKKILYSVLMPHVEIRTIRRKSKNPQIPIRKQAFVCPCSWKEECKHPLWDTLHQVIRHWGSVHLAEGFEILSKEDDRRIKLLGLQMCICCERILSRPDAMTRHKKTGSCAKPRKSYGYYAEDYLYWKYGGFKNWHKLYKDLKRRESEDCLS